MIFQRWLSILSVAHSGLTIYKNKERCGCIQNISITYNCLQLQSSGSSKHDGSVPKDKNSSVKVCEAVVLLHHCGNSSDQVSIVFLLVNYSQLFFSLTVVTVTLVKNIPGEFITMIDTEGHLHSISSSIVFKTLAVGWVAFFLSLIFNILYYALHPSQVAQ